MGKGHKGSYKKRKTAAAKGGLDTPEEGCSWQVPPDGLFDVIVPLLTSKQFVIVQLVCKDWSDAARACLKSAIPKRPDVDLSKLVQLYPNLTHVDLSNVEGLDARRLAALDHLTALKSLNLCNVNLPAIPTPAHKQQQHATAADGAEAQSPLPPQYQGAGAQDGQVLGDQHAQQAEVLDLEHMQQDSTGHNLPLQPDVANMGLADLHQLIAEHLQQAVAQQLDLPEADQLEAVADQQAAQQGSHPQLQQHLEDAINLADLQPVDNHPASTDNAEVQPNHNHQASTGHAVASNYATIQAGVMLNAEVSNQPGGLAHNNPSNGATNHAGAIAQPEVSNQQAATAETVQPPMAAATQLTAGMEIAQGPANTARAHTHTGPDAGTAARQPAPSDDAATAVHPRTQLPMLRTNSNPSPATTAAHAPPGANNAHAAGPSSRPPAFHRLPTPVSTLMRPPAARPPRPRRFSSHPDPSSLDAQPVQDALQDAHVQAVFRVLQCLTKLQADVSPTFHPEILASLTNLTELIMDTVVDTATLQGLEKLSALSVRKMAVPEIFSKLTQLTSLAVASESSAPGDFIPPCTALTALKELSFRTSAAKLQHVQEFEGWTGFSCLSSLDLRIPVEWLRPGLQQIACMDALHFLQLDLYCTNDVDLTVCITTPRKLQSLVVCTDKAKSGGLVEIKANAVLESMKLRLFWTPLNLVTDMRPNTADSSGMPDMQSLAGHASQSVGSVGDQARSVASDATVGGHQGVTSAHGNCGDRDAGAAAIGGVSPAGGQISATPVHPLAGLQHLTLDACFAVSFDNLIPAVKPAKLKTLTLDNSLTVEDYDLSLVTELKQLQEISISGCHLITDAGLSHLSSLMALRLLSLKGLRKLTVSAAQVYTRQRPVVKRYEDITGSFLTSLAPLPHLRIIALKHMHTCSASALASGLCTLTQLTRIDMKGCKHANDELMEKLTGMAGLKELNVTYCEGVSSRGRDAIYGALGRSIAFDFTGCSVPDLTRPCALPTHSTLATLEGDQASTSNTKPRASQQQSNQQV